MGKRPFIALLILVLLLSACTSDPAVGGPRLVQDVTLEATAIMPTRIQTATPIVIPIATSERVSPPTLETVEGRFPDFVLVTPTLPPSKTPTPTATISPTPTNTRPPTQTIPPPLFPTIVAGTPFVFNPAINPATTNLNCSADWFFGQPIPVICPVAQAVSSTAAYQQFQQGFMIWVGQQDMVYVVYDSVETPRWQMFRDEFVENMSEYDPSLVVDQPPYTWQPRRGFGLIWRDNPDVYRRLGWAVREWEEPFDTRLQIGLDGTVFLTEPRGGIIVLQPGGRDWDRYAGS